VCDDNMVAHMEIMRFCEKILVCCNKTIAVRGPQPATPQHTRSQQLFKVNVCLHIGDTDAEL
jgi:hypothetical protein